MRPRLTEGGADWYLKLRKQILNGRITRQTLNAFKREKDKRNILLYRSQENDLSIYFKACTLNLKQIIDFGFEECDLNPRDIRQSLPEIEEKLYMCRFCNMMQCNAYKITNEKYPPLMYVICFFKNKKPIIDNLLFLGVDDQSCSLGITPLQLACSLNDIEIIKILINRGKADAAKLDNMNNSSLIYTLLGGLNGWKMCLIKKTKTAEEEEEEENIKHDICTILLNNGADKVIDEREKIKGLKPIDIAIGLRYESIVNLLYKAKRPPVSQQL